MNQTVTVDGIDWSPSLSNMRPHKGQSLPSHPGTIKKVVLMNHARLAVHPQDVDSIASAEGKNAAKVKSSAMSLVIKHLLIQPHTSASLVQKIGRYSASHINHCLRKLRKAELIGTAWDCKQKANVYYNLKLELRNADSKEPSV